MGLEQRCSETGWFLRNIRSKFMFGRQYQCLELSVRTFFIGLVATSQWISTPTRNVLNGSSINWKSVGNFSKFLGPSWCRTEWLPTQHSRPEAFWQANSVTGSSGSTLLSSGHRNHQSWHQQIYYLWPTLNRLVYHSPEPYRSLLGLKRAIIFPHEKNGTLESWPSLRVSKAALGVVCEGSRCETAQRSKWVYVLKISVV